jgi:hypothetical protein
MLHRIITRLASALLVAGLLAAPATAGAKAHHKNRHQARHQVAKHKATTKSVGRTDEPQHPTEPSPPAPPHEPTDPAPHPDPVPPAPAPDAGNVVSFHEGILDVALGTGGHVVGKVIPGGTQFLCRSATTHEQVVEGCNASLLTPGAALHEFAVNYGPQGAWFQRIIIVLP